MADKGLTPQQLHFVDLYLQGDRNAAAAARGAGYSASYAQRAAATLLQQPAIRAEVDRRQAVLTAKSGLTLEQFDQVLAERGAIAVQKSQMNAAAKYDEMRGKLHGHLIERLQVDSRHKIDLREILEAADQRAIRPAAQIVDTTATLVRDAAHDTDAADNEAKKHLHD